MGMWVLVRESAAVGTKFLAIHHRQSAVTTAHDTLVTMGTSSAVELNLVPIDEPPAAKPQREALAARSFDALYERRIGDVSRWVRVLGTRDADCQDLVQEVFLVVDRLLSGFDGQNEAGWIFQIARRKVRDHRCLVWTQKFFGPKRVVVEEGTLWTNRGPLDELDRKQKARLLAQLVDRLTENERVAFLLFEVEGSTGQEIADILGAPINTVWARIFRARRKLQKELIRLEKPKFG